MIESFRFLTRSFVAGLAVAGVLAAGAPGGAQALQKVTVVSLPSDVSGALYYAKDLGLFTKAGLDVEIQGIATPSLTVQAVAGGTVDFGTSSTLLIARAVQGGIPIVLVAPSGATSVKAPLEGIIVGNDSGITSAKDLNGKTFVVSVRGSIVQIEALAWIDKHGGDWKSIKWVEAPPSADGAMVASGKVDATVVTEPYFSAALSAGNGKLLTYVGAEISPLVVEGGFYCTPDYAKNNPETVRKFADALLAAGKWANAHPAEAEAIMQKYGGLAPSPLQHRTVYPERFKASDLQSMLDAGAKYGALTASFPASDMVAPNIR
jgi:NitT/TauT family transport system substrate-binding protein